MIQAQYAIERFRRDLALSWLLNGALLALALVVMVLDAVAQPKVISGGSILLVIFGVWAVLFYFSIRGTRLLTAPPVLIAAGQYDQAEEQIDHLLRSFTLFRGIKLRALHHLAVLRHAQKRWGDAALLCQALLGQRLGAMRGLDHSARLILAESLLEVGDLPGAYQSIWDLYQAKLSLAEAVELLSIQLDYEARAGAWAHMVAGWRQKEDLLELLPTESAARGQAFLALAAGKTGRADLQQWLRRRAELLADPQDIAGQRPILSELWPA